MILAQGLQVSRGPFCRTPTQEVSSYGARGRYHRLVRAGDLEISILSRGWRNHHTAIQCFTRLFSMHTTASLRCLPSLLLGSTRLGLPLLSWRGTL